MLLDSTNFKENVYVLSIVGIGGLGKTALAQYVFHDEAVQKHFRPLIWVTVSKDFNVKKISEKIIASSKAVERPKHLEMDQIQNRLCKEIDGKRYLLVLDDLWNESTEERLKLKILLDGEARGSKILITTRALIIAKASAVTETTNLKGLSSSTSLRLFMRLASAEGQIITKTGKDRIGEEMVERCCGVPLAI